MTLGSALLWGRDPLQCPAWGRDPRQCPDWGRDPQYGPTLGVLLWGHDPRGGSGKVTHGIGIRLEHDRTSAVPIAMAGVTTPRWVVTPSPGTPP